MLFTQQHTSLKRGSGLARRPHVRACAGEHVLITGGNTGIGYETAKALLKQDYNVSIACRDPTRAGNAVTKLREEVAGAQVQSLQLDLADLQSVRDAAATWLDSGKPLHCLLNNAGVMACPKMSTKDGFEYQLGVNHLGHFLLTQLLLPALKANSGPSRIINVSSSAHTFGRINFDDLQSDKSYQPWVAYGQSKLANLLFTLELTRRLPPATTITVNSLHPGVVRTELSRYLITDPDSWTSKLFAAALTPFTKSPPEGAATSIFLASSQDVENVSGKYFVDCKPTTASAAAYDLDASRRLWEVSEELVS